MKSLKNLFRRIGAALILALALLISNSSAHAQFPGGAPQTILRVDGADGTAIPSFPDPTPDGSDWGAPAFKRLQDAIDKAIDITTTKPVAIWVRGGTPTQPMIYRPDQGANVTLNDPGASFNLAEQVYIYGGFAGTSGEQFNDRRPLERPTILSGDIDSDNVLDDDNSYHVVTADRVNNTALIDGFIIKHGYASDAEAPESGLPAGAGGGMLIIGEGGLAGPGSRPTVLRIVLTNNIAVVGGAVFITTGQGTGPVFYNCEFRNNVANNAAIPEFGHGGAVRGHLRAGGTEEPEAGVDPQFMNCVFAFNQSSGSGGAIYAGVLDTVTLSNCTISKNTAGGYAGGVYIENTNACDPDSFAGTIRIYNSIVWDNTSTLGAFEQNQV